MCHVKFECFYFFVLLSSFLNLALLSIMASIQLAVWFSSYGAFSLLSQRLISLVWLVPSAQLSSAHKVSNCASTVLSAYGFLVSVSLFDVRSFHSKQGHFLFFSPAEPSAIIPMADIIAYTCL
jgi:hypothetical protein